MFDVVIFAGIVLLILWLLWMHLKEGPRKTGAFLKAAILAVPAAIFCFFVFVKPYFGL